MTHFSDNDEVSITFSCGPSRISLLQGIFESYEGIGIVRTLESSEGKIAISTTASMKVHCLEVVHALISEGLLVISSRIEVNHC